MVVVQSGADRGIVGHDTFDLGASSTINAGNQEVQQLTPPDGFGYKILDVYFSVTALAGATSGAHHFYIVIYGTNHAPLLLSGKSLFGSNLEFGQRRWKTADSEQQPPSGTDQALVLPLGIATNAKPFWVYYDNDTDANQTNQRYLTIMVEKIKL